MKTSKKSSGFAETFRTILYAVLIAFVVRAFAYEPFSIPSGSMLPTLYIGDYLFVSKFSYGYSRYSVPPLDLSFIEGRIFGAEPERGAVVVFKLPRDGSTDYIKRVIGLPGERIQVIQGILHINGEPVERELIDGQVKMDDQPVQGINEYVETLPNGVKHLIWEETDQGFFDNTPVYTVPDGHYFVMGDNRDNSQDSRAVHQVGFVPAENIVGRAEILFFSHDPDISFWNFGKWLGGIRVGRMFDVVE
jgi:signal peptidase I